MARLPSKLSVDPLEDLKNYMAAVDGVSVFALETATTKILQGALSHDFFPSPVDLRRQCDKVEQPIVESRNRRMESERLAAEAIAEKQRFAMVNTPESRFRVKEMADEFLRKCAERKAQEALENPRIDPFVPGYIPSHIRPDDLRLAKAQDAGSDWRKAGGSAI
jgi:hypothetical protein